MSTAKPDGYAPVVRAQSSGKGDVQMRKGMRMIRKSDGTCVSSGGLERMKRERLEEMEGETGTGVLMVQDKRPRNVGKPERRGGVGGDGGMSGW